MLSKEQLESRANQIREYVKGNDWLVDEQIKAALENANALEEVISLREQLAELKALPPVGYVGNSDLYALSTGDLGCISPYNAFEGIPLFTAAKPSDSVTLPAPANYEDYGPMVSLEKTIAALALCGIEYTVKK
ncbi:TPA: hypothetical protein ACQQX6_004304 [Yersinia enterocolitica]|nr:hypothetical protein [Yersinia enterocolitica]HDZ9662513.1 hypothetical protein [Yersinia enterocolitica]HEM6603757.1 hypothetical protein [Yersinia enterocolitica]HEN3538687.1 hypothetical protein [Yersinia enterocolitica]